MTDRAKLEEAINYGRNMCNGMPWASWFQTMEALLHAAQAHLDTLPKTKMVEVKLWVRFDERGKVIGCGPLGAFTGRTFQMHEEPPKVFQADAVVFVGTAEVAA